MMVSKVVTLGDSFRNTLAESLVLFEIDRALRQLLVDDATVQTFTIQVVNLGNAIRVDVDDNRKA